MEEKIRMTTRLTGEEEVCATSRGRRETWKAVAAMEDGRTIEVIGMMSGGMGKKRAEKNRNPWNTPSSESEPEKVPSEAVRLKRQMKEFRENWRRRWLRRWRKEGFWTS